MPYTFTVAMEIEANREDTFEYAMNFKNRTEWDELLLEAHLVPPAISVNQGTKVWYVAVNGSGMETAFTLFDAPRMVRAQMTKGPYMFKQFEAAWAFNKINVCKTRVLFIYSFTLRLPYALFGWLIRNHIRTRVERSLQEMKYILEEVKTSNKARMQPQ